MDRFDAIRAIAGRVLEDFERKANRKVFTESAATHSILAEIAFRCFELIVSEDPTLPEGVIGQLDWTSGSIAIRCDLEIGRRAFTIAHELGHRALDHPAGPIFDTDGDINETPDFAALHVQNGIYRSYDERSLFELEANVFAAELLAPVALVRREVFTQEDWTVKSLADYFGLSRSAMLNQLVAALLPGPAGDLLIDEQYEAKTPDSDQQAAVNARTPALVIAGPGAGKTRILVDRFAKLVQEGTPPRRILALTFANKAAEEMRSRVCKALPEYAHEIEVSTFHSFGLNLLRQYGQNIGLKCPIKLLTPLDAFVLVKKRLASMPMGGFEDLQRPARNLVTLFSAISRAKDELVDPMRFLELSRQWQAELDSTPAEGELETLERSLQQAKQCVDAAHFYAAYEDLLRTEGVLDYGDLIADSVKLLDHAAAGDEIRNRYDHILVDEFQDINYASGRLLSALDAGRGIVWVVGDPKQSIYRFRGASPNNIFGFTADYPGANVISLDRNYRSVKDIVECGLAIEIPTRVDGKAIEVPRLVSHRGRIYEEPAVSVITASDSKTELSELVCEVTKAATEHRRKDIAVLCRTRAQAQLVSDTLEHAGLQTTWTGALQDRSVFKDIMGVFYLISDDIRGLARLSQTSEHCIPQNDIRRLIDWSSQNTSSAIAALYAACDGRIDGLSVECIGQAERLKRLVGSLRMQPTAFHMVTSYLFENTVWLRQLVTSGLPESRQVLGTLGQICGLARAFASSIAGQENPPDASHFVDYLESCVEAGELVAPFGESSDTDAIGVMTVHGSKGLQWPVVFIPFMAERKFPYEGRHDPVPIPPGLICGEDANDAYIEEACLFYVAATRAQNQLILMRAEKYHRASRPSIFIDQVLAGLSLGGFVKASTVHPDIVVVSSQDAAEMGSDYSFDRLIKFSALRTYEVCPKRFEFEHVLGLKNDDTGYRDFHTAIYSTMKRLVADACSSGQPSAADALAVLDQEWLGCGPVGHWYEERYKRNAEALVSDFVKRLRSGSSLALRQEKIINTGGRDIAIIVDEIEDSGTVTLRWQRYGKPAKSHSDDHMPALMAAIGQKYYPGREVIVKLHYPLAQHEQVVTPTARVVDNRVKKMANLAAAAETGPYCAKYSPFLCKTCHFTLICPAGGDEDGG